MGKRQNRKSSGADHARQKPHQNLVLAARIVKPQKNKRRKKLKTVDQQYVAEWDRGTKSNPGKSRARQSTNDNVSIRAPKEMAKKYVQQDTASEKELAYLKELVGKVPKSQLKGRTNPFFPVQKEDIRGMKRAMKKTPNFKQGTKETDAAFMSRVELTSQRVIAASQFQDKYKVTVAEAESGNLRVIDKKDSKKAKKNTERLREKKVKQKEKMIERIENKKSGFENFTDTVQFGEVAMEPPKISAMPRKADKKITKAGQRSLLLQKVIHENQQSSVKRQIGQTQKRKLLSPAQQLIMDTERSNAIDLYRQQKAKKMMLHT